MTSLLTMIGIGSTIGIISIYFVNKFPGEPTEYVCKKKKNRKKSLEFVFFFDVIYRIASLSCGIYDAIRTCYLKVCQSKWFD